MASPTPSKKGTNQFMRQGHTSNEYGNNPTVDQRGPASASPKELKA